MFRQAVPRVERKVCRKSHLLRRVELLPRYAQPGNRHERRQSLRPTYRGVFDRHAKRIGLKLERKVEFDILLRQRLNHVVSKVVGRRRKGQMRNPANDLRLRIKRIHHGLSFAEKVRYTAPESFSQCIALSLTPHALHQHVQEVRISRIDEIVKWRSLQAPGLKLDVCARVWRCEN